MHSQFGELDYDYLCRQTLASHNKILGVWVIKEEAQIAFAAKRGAPIPNKEELQRIFHQARLMISMASTNEKFYGKIESIVVNHEKLSAFLVPIDREYTIAIGCTRPFNFKAVIDSIERIMGEA